MDTKLNSGVEPTGPLVSFNDITQWQFEASGGAIGNLVEEDHEPETLKLEISGQGQILLRPSAPVPIADHLNAAQLWVCIDDLPPSPPTLSLLFEDGKEASLGSLEVSTWNYLHKTIDRPKNRLLTAIAIRGSFLESPQRVALKELRFLHAGLDEPMAASKPLEVLSSSRSMRPACQEETDTSIKKDGISFIFESRSLSTVVRFIYTPIEGNLADIELEINNEDAVNPADGGGISIEMGGNEWTADDENIERHFVSCEQVDDCIEARWQWKLGDELADFLYRIRLENKSLVVELEGGNGKATGVDLGQVVGALHPRLIAVPYFSLGDSYPKILATSGVFVSSFLDAYRSNASQLVGPSPSDAAGVQLNGGALYSVSTENKRGPLRETWYLTVSRAFDEILPSLATPEPALPPPDDLKNRLWFLFSNLDASEGTYVEWYEQLLNFKQWGMDRLLVHHSSDTWHDSNGTSGFTSAGSETKGGDDALSEYLEALADLQYPYSLSTNYTKISPSSDDWNIGRIVRDQSNELAHAGPGHFRLKTGYASTQGPAHAQALAEQYGSQVQIIDQHAATPPWTRLDADQGLPAPVSFQTVLNDEQSLFWQLAQQRPTLAEGGSHWLYTGLAHGFFAVLAGEQPARMPWLVDFDLRNMHPYQTDGGMGTIEQYLGTDIPDTERHSRSAHLDRYIAATLAFGHAALLTDPTKWGMASAIKVYCMLLPLQNYYLGVPVSSIRYHHEGNLLETGEAIFSGSYQQSQVEITYTNGFQVFANGSWELDWEIEVAEKTYRLPPAAFLARSPDGVLAYSADDGQGRVDYARCPDYLFFDTRGARREMESVSLDGAALITNQNWEIDIYPVEVNGPIEVQPTFYWQERRLPKLRVLAFKSEEEAPENLKSDMVDNKVVIQPVEGAYKYRITLPEWMVEPGK
jgi:hypothetical protein